MRETTISPIPRVRGELRLPGDKSISHRALIFGAVADGTSRVRGLGAGGDVRSTRAVLEALGVTIRDERDAVVVEGRGWTGLWQGEGRGVVDLYCGNSGTTARTMLGLLAGGRGTFRLSGDASLSRRPMRRVTAPLAKLGARIEDAPTLPITVTGASLRGARVSTGVASAQVKTALILAALQAEGPSEIGEPRPTRDHTERLLRAMGVPLEVREDGHSLVATAGGRPRLAPIDLDVPGDPSSSAYALALACLLPGSEVVVEGVLLNPGRIGFYRLLQRMGADLSWTVERDVPEPVGTVRAASSELHGIEVTAEDVVDAVDEIPLLAVVAALARGRTTIRGAEELRVKESDRLAATARLLGAFGARVAETRDGLDVEGGTRVRAGRAETFHDHRIAMCGAVLGALADGPSTIDGSEWIAISYPSFFDDVERLAGAPFASGT